MQNIQIKGGPCEKPQLPVDPMELIKELRAALEITSTYIPLPEDIKPGTTQSHKDRITNDLRRVNKAIADSEVWQKRIEPHIYGTPEVGEAFYREGYTAIQVTVQQLYVFPDGRNNGLGAHDIAEELFGSLRIRGSHAWRDGSHLGGGDVVIGIKTIADPHSERLCS